MPLIDLSGKGPGRSVRIFFVGSIIIANISPVLVSFSGCLLFGDVLFSFGFLLESFLSTSLDFILDFSLSLLFSDTGFSLELLPKSLIADCFCLSSLYSLMYF